MKRQAIPALWGAYWALAAAAIGTIAGIAGELGSHSVYTFAGCGFAWGWTMAHVWNWLGRRSLRG